MKKTERKSAITARLRPELRPTSPPILPDKNVKCSEITGLHHCENEMERMLAVIENQSKCSLFIMGRQLASHGQSLDKVFMRHFLDATMER